MTQPPRLHPVSQPLLILVIIVAFLAGTLCLSTDETAWGLVWFAWSLTAFVLQVVAWLLREHELWRNERFKQPGDSH